MRKGLLLPGEGEIRAGRKEEKGEGSRMSKREGERERKGQHRVCQQWTRKIGGVAVKVKGEEKEGGKGGEGQREKEKKRERRERNKNQTTQKTERERRDKRRDRQREGKNEHIHKGRTQRKKNAVHREGMKGEKANGFCCCLRCFAVAVAAVVVVYAVAVARQLAAHFTYCKRRSR